MIAELILSIILWRMWHISGPVDNEACRSPSILIRVYLSCSSGFFFSVWFSPYDNIFPQLQYVAIRGWTQPMAVICFLERLNLSSLANLVSRRFILLELNYVHFLCCTEWNQYVLAKDTKLHEKFTRTFSPTLRLIRWWIKGNVDQNVRSRWIFIIEQIELFYLYKPF